MGSSDFLEWLVVVKTAGASEAELSQLLSALPAGFPATLIVAIDAPDSTLEAAGLALGRQSLLPVMVLKQSEELRPSTLYLAASGGQWQISGQRIVLSPERSRGSTLAALLNSAAPPYGEHLIAIFLGEADAEGAAGAHIVKQAGGTVMIQLPDPGSLPALPPSLEPQTIDILTEPGRIGEMLRGLVLGIYSSPEQDQERELQAFLAELRDSHGVDFRSYKPPTILRRLQRRIVASDTQTLQSYREYLRGHPEEYQKLISSFLINVTQFMRDPELFNLLQEQVLPELLRRSERRGNELRLWSAGCATGEEAYSLAILLCELLGDSLSGHQIKIFATDLDPTAVAFARQGIYPASALAELPEPLISRYFNFEEGAYAVKKQVRRLIVFGEHDLSQRAPFPHIDLVLCRNVLIYFSKELQQRTLQLFAFSLRDEGYLVLGKAESASLMDAYFVTYHQQYRIYRRQGERVLIPPPRPQGLSHTSGRRLQRMTRKAPPLPPLPHPAQAIQQARHSGDLLQRMPLGVVLVNAHYDIQEINNTARRMLNIRTTALGADLIHLVEYLPSRQLRAAVDTALQQGIGKILDPIKVEDPSSGSARYLELSCYPLLPEEIGQQAQHALILIVDISEGYHSSQRLQHSLDERQMQIDELRREVAELRASTMHLEDSNRKLQSALVSSTGSTPDAQMQVDLLAEQTRANAELKHTIEQLRAERQQLIQERQESLRLDSENQERLQQLIGEHRALIAANEELVRINEAERTTSEEYLISNEEAQAAMEEVETLYEEMQATNEELETLNEEYQSTIEELNTSNADLAARGHELQVLASSLEQERAQLAAVLSTMPDALLVVKPDGTLLLANQAYREFIERYGRLEDEQEQQLSPEKLLQQRATRGERFSLTLTSQPAQGGRRWFEVSGEPSYQNEQLHWVVVVIRDITERSLRAMQEQFLSMASHELRTPILPIQGYLEMLIQILRQQPENERALRAATRAHSQTKRLARLVDDLLDIVRLENGKFTIQPEPIQLDLLLAEIATIARTLTTRQTIRLSNVDEPIVVRGDPERLQQVVLNLITNTIRHAAESEFIDLGLSRDGTFAQLEVRDYGPGIEPTLLAQIFTRFYQVEGHDYTRQSQGLGLGLYISRQIVEAHGGRIDVSSQPGHGATFRILLPLS